MLMWSGKLEEGLGPRFILGNWLMLVVFFAFSNFIGTPAITRGILLGGVVANLNCMGILRDVKRLVRWRRQFVYFFGMITRMILIALVLGILLVKFSGKISVIGVFLGVSVVPATFLVLLCQIQLLKYSSKSKKVVCKKLEENL